MKAVQESGRPGTPVGGHLQAAVVLAARDLQKSYRSSAGAFPVLRGVSLEIKKGEFVALMGPSGCGKSTLLNCLSGLDRPDQGLIRFEGTDLAQANDRVRTRLRGKRMGFVFQAFNLIPVIPVLANVRLPLELMGIARKPAERQARLALAAVGMEAFEGRRPLELSGGEQQRVAIARALVNGPALVYADEPTGNLDSATGQQVVHLFRALARERGTTFFVVTHDPVVARAADRVLRMDSGRLTQGNVP